MYVYVHLWLYIHFHVWIIYIFFICIHLHIHAYIYIYTCIHIHVLYVYIYIYMYINIFIYTYVIHVHPDNLVYNWIYVDKYGNLTPTSLEWLVGNVYPKIAFDLKCIVPIYQDISTVYHLKSGSRKKTISSFVDFMTLNHNAQCGFHHRPGSTTRHGGLERLCRHGKNMAWDSWEEIMGIWPIHFEKATFNDLYIVGAWSMSKVMPHDEVDISNQLVALVGGLKTNWKLRGYHHSW